MQHSFIHYLPISFLIQQIKQKKNEVPNPSITVYSAISATLLQLCLCKFHFIKPLTRRQLILALTLTLDWHWDHSDHKMVEMTAFLTLFDRDPRSLDPIVSGRMLSQPVLL